MGRKIALLVAIPALLYAAYALAQTSDTSVGRLPLAHPDLGHVGGSVLHTKVRNAWTSISDEMMTRAKEATSVADSAVTTFDHNFGADFAELCVRLYDGTGAALTRVQDPSAAGWTIAAGTNPLTQIDVTAPSSGGPHDFTLISLVGDCPESLDDLDDVDLVTSPPEDGQALVWDGTNSEFIPGASGDSSFKLQSVADPNATIKAGFIILDDGRELRIPSDFALDLDATSADGNCATPADNASCYLYVDLDQLPSSSTLTNGRIVYDVNTTANWFLSETDPDSIQLTRYVPIGLVHTADSGNAWSGTGADFATLATRRHDKPVAAVSPVVYDSGELSIGSVGAVANAPGALSDSDFPTPANAGYWPLSGDALNDGAAGSDLTNNSVLFEGRGFFGRENTAKLDGSNDSFSSSNAHFNPGNGVSYSMGLWIYKDDYEFSTTEFLMAGRNASSDRTFQLFFNAGNVLQFEATNSPSSMDTSLVVPIDNLESGWHHVAMVYDFANTNLLGYINGKRVVEGTLANTRSASTVNFHIGSLITAGSGGFQGKIQDAFFVNGDALSDAEVNAIYSRRFNNNAQIAGGHVLEADSFNLDSLTDKAYFWNISGNANDSSVNSVNLTNNGPMTFTLSDLFGVEQVADSYGDLVHGGATTEYFSSSNAAFAVEQESEFSIGGWFQTPNWFPSSSQSSLYFIGEAANVASGHYVRLLSTGDLQVVGATGSGTNEFFNYPVPSEWTNGDWHHIATVYRNGSVSLYLDGALATTQPAAFTSGTTDSIAYFTRLSSSSGVDDFYGTGDELFFAKYALTDSDIKKLASAKIPHSANVASAAQGWQGTFTNEIGGAVEKDLLPQIVDQKADDLFIDFGDYPSGGKVQMKMSNSNPGGLIIDSESLTIGPVDSAPASPLAHGLPCIPSYRVEQEGVVTASRWADITHELHCEVDATNLYCDFSGISVSATEELRIKMACSDPAIAVPAAGATDSGIVTTAAQTFAGDKTFSGTVDSAEYTVLGNPLNYFASGYFTINVGLGASDFSSQQMVGNHAIARDSHSNITVNIACDGAAATGTTCAGNEVYGVQFTAPVAGVYEVCMEGSFQYSMLAANAKQQLILKMSKTADGSSTILVDGQGDILSEESNDTSYITHSPYGVCGMFELTASENANYKVFVEYDVTGSVSSGTFLCANITNGCSYSIDLKRRN